MIQALTLIYFIIIAVTFVMSLMNFGEISITPAQIYESNNLNMFGCVVMAIIFFILNPIYYFVYFVYWLFHVGRKD